MGPALCSVEMANTPKGTSPKLVHAGLSLLLASKNLNLSCCFFLILDMTSCVLLVSSRIPPYIIQHKERHLEMCSGMQADAALDANFPEITLLQWMSSMILPSQPSLCRGQVTEPGHKTSPLCPCLMAGLSVAPPKAGAVAPQSSPLIFSSTHRAPVSEAARAENTALHQRHRDTEREREREKSHSLTGKGCDCPTPDRLLRGGGRQEACAMLRKALLQPREHFTAVLFVMSHPESFCLGSGTFGICRRRRKRFQLAAWK